jgi:hypothetical protein
MITDLDVEIMVNTLENMTRHLSLMEQDWLRGFRIRLEETKKALAEQQRAAQQSQETPPPPDDTSANPATPVEELPLAPLPTIEEPLLQPDLGMTPLSATHSDFESSTPPAVPGGNEPLKNRYSRK